MKHFNFKVNEHGDTCHIFKNNEDVPIDVVYLVETDDGINSWFPRSHEVQELLEKFTKDLNDVMEFYKENYIEICEVLSPKHLLKLPERIDGFYMNYGTEEISECGGHLGYGVVHTYEQAKAMEAFCKLSHVLAVFNQGWKPDYSTKKDKWYIQTFNHEVKVTCSYHAHSFLVFETEKKAKLFLKLKEEEVTDLSKGGII